MPILSMPSVWGKGDRQSAFFRIQLCVGTAQRRRPIARHPLHRWMAASRVVSETGFST